MNFKHLSVKAKLSAAFGLLATVVLIVSGISLKELNDANDRFSGYVSGINARAEMAEAVRTAVDDRAIAVRNLVLVTAPADVELEKAAVTAAEQRVETNLEKFNAMVANASDMTDKGRSLAAELPRIEGLYRPVAGQSHEILFTHNGLRMGVVNCCEEALTLGFAKSREWCGRRIRAVEFARRVWGPEGSACTHPGA